MRSILIIILAGGIILSSGEEINGQNTYWDRSYGDCSKHKTGKPYLFYNLMPFECMLWGELPDSNQIYAMAAEAGNVIGKAIPSYENISKWTIWALYCMEQHKDIQFLMIPNPHNPDQRFTVARNKVQNRYYLLGGKDVDMINNLLGSEEFYLYSDRAILAYCWLITSLRNPSSNIRFISSIKEILVEAIFIDPIIHDLSKVSKYKNDVVELPTIKRSWRKGTYDPLEAKKMEIGIDTVSVEFFMAKDTDIVEVHISLSGPKIIDYEEIKVTKTTNWYGHEIDY
jgi:hypothetical protein